VFTHFIEIGKFWLAEIREKYKLARVLRYIIWLINEHTINVDINISGNIWWKGIHISKMEKFNHPNMGTVTRGCCAWACFFI
jgi:hypothetical protein